MTPRSAARRGSLLRPRLSCAAAVVVALQPARCRAPPCVFAGSGPSSPVAAAAGASGAMAAPARPARLALVARPCGRRRARPRLPGGRFALVAGSNLAGSAVARLGLRRRPCGVGVAVVAVVAFWSRFAAVAVALVPAPASWQRASCRGRLLAATFARGGLASRRLLRRGSLGRGLASAAAAFVRRPPCSPPSSSQPPWSQPSSSAAALLALSRPSTRRGLGRAALVVADGFAAPPSWRGALRPPSSRLAAAVSRRPASSPARSAHRPRRGGARPLPSSSGCRPPCRRASLAAALRSSCAFASAPARSAIAFPHMQNGRAAGAPRTPEDGKNTEPMGVPTNMPHLDSPTITAPKCR